MTETQLREEVRNALKAYRDHHANLLDSSDGDYDHHLVSKTQIESVMRVLWMDS